MAAAAELRRASVLWLRERVPGVPGAWLALVAREGGERLAWMCLTILMMLPGMEDRVMTVVTPAEVARRAATILVDMPPVPREEPADETGGGLV